MSERIMLCLDEATYMNPELIGLGDEPIEAHAWLDVLSTGDEARTWAQSQPEIGEAWVVSCDDVEPINLAATLKSDRPDLRVCLVTGEPCGSLFSRAHTAEIDEVLEMSAFLKRYAQAKRERAGEQPSGLKGQAKKAAAGSEPHPEQEQEQKPPAKKRIHFGLRSRQSEARAREGGLQRIDRDASDTNGVASQQASAPKQAPAATMEHASATQQASALAPQSAATMRHASAPQQAPATTLAPQLEQTLALQQGSTLLSAMVAPAPQPAPAPAPQPAPVPQPAPASQPALRPQLQTAQLQAPAAGRAFMLTVVSGSGGAGKSAVSAIAALVACNAGHRTLLLDCDLQFGDVAGMVGARDPLRIDEALAHPDRLEHELAAAGDLVVLGAPERLETAEQVVAHLPGLIDQLLPHFDAIVANTGASWAEQHAALLERSSAALFLIDQRVSSVRACQHAFELCARCGIATGPFQFALNRCAKGAPLTPSDVSAVLQGAPVYELKEGGRDVEDYLSAGAASELLEMHNEFALSVQRVVEHIVPAVGEGAPAVAPKPEQRSILRRHGAHGKRKRGR